MKNRLATLRNVTLGILFVFALVVTMQNHSAQKRLDLWLQRHADIQPFLMKPELQKLNFLSTENNFEVQATEYLAVLQRMWQVERDLENSRERQLLHAAANSFSAIEEHRKVPASLISQFSNQSDRAKGF